MPQGLEIYDASSNLVLGISNRLGKVLGSDSVTGTGSVSVPGAALGTPFVQSIVDWGFDEIDPGLTEYNTYGAEFSGTTLSWNVLAPYTTHLVYGVF